MTVLTATPSAATGKVVLAITGAPGPPAAAYSGFTTGMDYSWVGSGPGGGGYTLTWDTAPTPDAARLQQTSGPFTSYAQASRLVTGLTIGANYKFTVWATRSRGQVRLSTGVGGVICAPPAGVRTPLSYTFTATATSHTLSVDAVPDQMTSTYGLTWFDTVTLTTTAAWQGTWATRTDANGTDVPVREDVGGLDVAPGGSTLTLTDFEAAQSGTVTYTAHDGNGGTALAATTFDALGAGVWLTAPATAIPSTGTAPATVAVQLVTGYTDTAESSGTLHPIIGRADRVATPGPLGLRRGTLDLWTASYPAATAVRALAATGEILFLRQPTHPGLDLYFYPTSVAARPEAQTGSTRRWIVSLTFEQVLATYGQAIAGYGTGQTVPSGFVMVEDPPGSGLFSTTGLSDDGGGLFT